MFDKIKKSFLILLVLITTVTINVFAENKLLFQEEIAPGVIRYQYQINNGSKKARANVVKVDLNNPYIKINTVAGKGTYTNKATVSQMGNRTNAVALVNGDFFSMQLQGVPLGASMIDGDLKSSPAVLTDIWTFGIDTNNKAFIDLTKFNGKVTAPNGNSYPIAGLNKASYWYQPSKEYSHESKIQMYDSFWSSKSRGDKTAGEVLLSKDNVVEQIVFRKNIDMAIPQGKKVLQVSGGSERFIRDNVKVGDKLNITTSVEPNRSWKMMIGGHALLVENGAVKNYTKDINSIGGTRARTAVGISQDGKTVYIASVEGRTKRSSGASLPELSRFMLDLGSYKAMNLDGGGSSAMVVRELGNINRTRVTNPERNAGERAVVNGLGVFNTTKNTGVIVNGKLDGETNLIVGEQTDFTFKSAWDAYLNPIDIKNRNYTLKENSNGQNILNGRTYLALTPGSFKLNLTTDKGESFSKDINISDINSYKSISAKSDKMQIKEGDLLTLTIEGKYNNKNIKISPRVAKFEFQDLDASVDPNNFKIKVNKIYDNPKIKVIVGDKSSEVALFDKDSKVIKMQVGSLNYSVDGKALKLDSKPFIKNSRTLVPVRFIVEAIGGEVEWDNANRIVNINSNGNTIKLPINSKTITVNGEEKSIDQAAIISGDRTFVPVRFVAESLNMNVSYNDKTREILIISKKQKAAQAIENKTENLDDAAKNNLNNAGENVKNSEEIKNNQNTNANEKKAVENNNSKEQIQNEASNTNEVSNDSLVFD
ncbi:stalk domain-containing protein [Peptoniphilus sp.]|jgi:exopolysaccharide biosynthesis protein|uniref:stalk domain-containing protein n=1 Tax=Peptoniphilus sp. TaxID=1971214 RepID=UPI003D945E20